MKKIAILGCENSHADAFIGLIQSGKYPQVEVVGVYTDDKEAERRITSRFGVYAAQSAEEFVGRVDGIMITARHGDNHLKYARPYIASSIPMFIDKPATASASDAAELSRLLLEGGIRFSGGSSCVHAPEVLSMKELARKGEVLGGFVRAPISLNNAYGNIWFYSQHLVQIAQTVFGYFPSEVSAVYTPNGIDATLYYEKYNVFCSFVEGNYNYSLTLSLGDQVAHTPIAVTEAIYVYEMDEYYKLLMGGQSPMSHKEFFAPVYVIDAIIRALESTKREKVLGLENFNG